MTKSEQTPIAVTCEHVSKRYLTRSAEVTALNDVSVTVRPGEFVSLLGPSGCGKTTLLRLIAGLEQPSDGDVRIDEQEVRDAHPDLGVVFQTDLLMPWRTVLDNVLLQAEVRGQKNPASIQRAKDLLAQVGLQDFVTSYPHELSGGMKQRVGICRALLHKPRLLLMDEPFAALDAMTRDQISVELSELASHAGTTIVFVTHSIPEAVFLSDRIYVMSARPGRIAAEVVVDQPQPRQLHYRQNSAFISKVAEVTAIFESLGVLRDNQQQSVEA
ncbi:ABC transporter ATP-binding protein [Leucobacter luti]|uniref:ABC transporter ATP-binding protein n=1 Tax=Leucobacter luti TaxID=340320 RepID=UPI00104852A7|nr:ABC transporter ATP-binding protein [Leucobacter luti]MCW2286960.1 NitT/TauT family transport system ATP-binding protein [Leucobacter luti]QYM76862.1 ABC transporter ATP-binding protein [Leucobacter luti]TCK41187.1 NitT/TauT family transport system ATP-binding protein [Leucobacter luti]